MTGYEVINRFVDVDGTNKIIRGVQGIMRLLEVMFFFVDVYGTLSDFMRTILVYLFCGHEPPPSRAEATSKKQNQL